MNTEDECPTNRQNEIQTFPFTLDFRFQVEVDSDIGTNSCWVVFTNTWLGNLSFPHTHSLNISKSVTKKTNIYKTL